MLLTPTEYVAKKRAEGMADGEIIARQLEVLAKEAEAFRIADEARAYAEEKARRIIAERKADADRAAQAQWYRRAVLAEIAREGKCFPPGRKTAHFDDGDLLVREEKPAVEIRDAQALKALVPDATREQWSATDAKAALAWTPGGLIVAETGEAVPPEVATFREGGSKYLAKVGGLTFELPAWAPTDDEPWPDGLPAEEDADG